MNIQFLGTALVGSLALMGCSGSNGALVTSIFAGGEAIEPGDYAGKTFPVRFIGVREGSGVELLRGTGSIRIVSDDVIEVSIAGRNYTLDYNGFDGFESSEAFAELSLEFPELATGFLADIDSDYVGGYGFQTAVQDMPMSDLVSYFDLEGSSLVLTNGSAFATLDGETDLLVSFGSGDVIGYVFINDGIGVEVTNGKINGNTFSGGLIMTDGIGEIALTNTDLDGWFYGAEADSLFGTFEGEFVNPSEVEGATNFVGGFLAEKSPPPL